MNPIVVIDFETSAFPEDGGAPINFAAALLDSSTLKVLSTFERYMLLEPEDMWDDGAEKVHHITRKRLAEDGIPRVQAYEDFTAWMRSNGLKPTPECESWDRPHLCGHNVEFFDQGILSGEKGMGRELFKRWFHYRVIDTMKVAFFLDMCYVLGGDGHVFLERGNPSVKLGALQRMFNIRLADLQASCGLSHELSAHNALGDVLVTAEALRRMVSTVKGGIAMLKRLGEFRKHEASLADTELGAATRTIFGARK